MALTPTNKNNPCPICENASGSCRQRREDLSYWQCMTYADAKKGEVIGRWKSLGPTTNKLWAQFKPDNSSEWTEEKRREWQLENQLRNAEKARVNAEAIQKSLNDEKRHEQYTKLFAELKATNGLKPEHRQDLIRRGLTNEQIGLFGAVSFVGFQQLRGEYSELLPGITIGGKQISVGGTGYIYPIRNARGQITGAQIRSIAISGLEAPEKKQPKYKWLSGGAGTLQQYPKHHKEGGELPISVHYPTEIKKLAIGIVEGTGVKPFLAAQKLGIPFIGASGGQHASSPALLNTAIRETKEWLWKKFNPRVGEKAPIVKCNESNSICEILVFPDAGCIQNQGVMTQLEATTYELRDEAVKIAWWGQTTKAAGDIDEIDLTTTGIKYLSPKEFLAFAKTQPTEQKGFSQGYQERAKKASSQKKYVRPIQELPKAGFHVLRRTTDELPFDALNTERGEEWLQLRKFTPDVTIDSQYFDYEFKSGENLAIKSGLGTGKSYFTNAKWLDNPEEGAVLGGYRNCLNEQFCANGKKLNGQTWYQIQQDLKGSRDRVLVADPQSRIAGAVDSWIYFAPHHFEEKKVIFDEVESVAKHLNQSSTAVSFYRDVVKQRVSDALSNSIANLIADGNLRDFTVDYIEEISGGRKFTKILNNFTGNRGTVYLYNGSCRKRKASEEDVKQGWATKPGEWISFDHKPDDYSKLHRLMVEMPTDIPLLILSDSQKKCEAWDRELSGLGRRVFRLDSTTSTSDLGLAFLRDPRKFILSERIDTVILSPSAESGVSIELADELKRKIPGYFKYEFASFFGISTTDTQTQFLGRNRDTYTIKFVYVQTHIQRNKQINDSHTSVDVFQSWVDINRECASLSLKGIEYDEIWKLAEEKIKAALFDPHAKYESKVELKESFEKTYPRLCLEHALREQGWDVVLIEGGEDSIEDLIAFQEEIAEENSQAVYASQELQPSETEVLSRKPNKAPEERHQIAKSRLLSRLPGISQKIVQETRKIKTVEQLQKIEESELVKPVVIGDVLYEEWKANPQPIPEKGVKVTVEKPAFDPTFIDKVLNKDRTFVFRLEMQFLLRNPDLCKLIQQHKWHKKLDLLTDPDCVAFGRLSIARHRSKLLEVHTLIEMGIGFFLGSENSWHNKSPEAIAFWEKGKIPRNAQNTGIGTYDDPCQYIGKVLKRFGLKTQNKQKSNPDGTRYREYSICKIDSLSQAVYDCVEQRIQSQVSTFNFDWKKILQNSGFNTAATLTEQELHAAHNHPDNYIKARVVMCSAEAPATTTTVERLVTTGQVATTHQDTQQADTELSTEGDEVPLEEALSYCESQGANEDLVIEELGDLGAEVLAEAAIVEQDEDAITSPSTESAVGRLYQVRQFEGGFGTLAETLAVTWMPNCRLVQLPSQFQDYYVFETPEGNRIPVADEDCFEPMEVEPTATLGEQLLYAFRIGPEALREFLGGMSQFDAWSAVMDAEALNPDEFSRLPEVAPDWVSWMPSS